MRLLHCYPWPFWQYHSIPHYFITGTIFRGGGAIDNKRCFGFFKICSQTFLILRRIQRCFTINICSSSLLLIIIIFNNNNNKLKLIIIIARFEWKWSNIIFHRNPSIGSRLVQCGWTDGRTDRNDEVGSRFSQFCRRH